MDSGSRNTCIIFNPLCGVGAIVAMHCQPIRKFGISASWRIVKGRCVSPTSTTASWEQDIIKGDEKGIHPRHLTFEGSGKTKIRPSLILCLFQGETVL